MNRTPETAVEPQLWSTAESPAEVLQVGDARLRRWTLRDVEPLHAAILRSQPHLQPWMPWAQHVPADDPGGARDYLERSVDQWVDRTTFNYGVVDADSGAILGSAGLMGRVEPGALEIGYWIHVDQTGRGLATRAAAALTEAAFAIGDVRRVEIHHDSANTVSGRIPARLGYVRLREEPADSPAPGGTGIHVVWGMDRDAWPGSTGQAYLQGVRLSPGPTR